MYIFVPRQKDELPFYLSEDWSRRRSERIFLNDIDAPRTFKMAVALSSPPLPHVTSPKPDTTCSSQQQQHQQQQQHITSPKKAVSDSVMSKVVAPKLTAPSPCSGVTTAGSMVAISRSSMPTADQRSRMKCVHDLSQKVKKKYSKTTRKHDARKLVSKSKMSHRNVFMW